MNELSTFLKNDSMPSFETLCAALLHRSFSWHHLNLTVNYLYNLNKFVKILAS